MSLIIERKDGTVAPIPRLEQTKKDLRLYSIDFSGRYSRTKGQGLPDDLISWRVGRSTASAMMVNRWLNENYGGESLWNFLQLGYKTDVVLQIFDQSFPHRMPFIDRLAHVLELDRGKVLEGIMQTNALLKDRSNLPTAIALQNGNCIVLGRRHFAAISEDNSAVFASLGYFLGAKTNRRRLRQGERNSYALVRAQTVEVISEALLLPVLCLGSFEASEDYHNGFVQIFTRKPVIRLY